MMAALIFLISLVTLFMFFVSYCRSMMASAARHELSEEVRDVTGIQETASAGDYKRVVQILQLCPERPEDRSSLRAVDLYHSCLKTVQGALATVMPKLEAWIDREQASCAYFAAVALDRRISFNREMLAQQVEP
jgi:hypothetical protein